LLEEKLNQLENKVNGLKEEKIRTEEKLKNLRKQKEAIISELAEFGVSSTDLETKINELKTQISTTLQDIKQQIPEDIE